MVWMWLERRQDQQGFAVLKSSAFIPRVMGSRDGCQAINGLTCWRGQGCPVSSTDGEWFRMRHEVVIP